MEGRFRKELSEEELKLKNSKLINSYDQHLWIANMFDWAGQNGELKDFTPIAYSNIFEIKEEGSFVVKGATNSRKHQWNTCMFAETKADIGRVISNLMKDSLIADQKIAIRPYVPLETIDIGINGLPITNEWRTFWFVKDRRAHLVGKGFYWSSFEELQNEVSFDTEGEKFANFIAQKVSKFANFFVLDLAKTKEGNWILIEINDAQMSGLSLVSHEDLYKNIYKVINSI